MTQLLPEWYPQEAVVLAWPDQNTDWAPWLKQVQSTYLELINAISANQCAVILLIKAAQISSVQALLGGNKRVLLIEADYNDTWVRDYAFLTCKTDTGMQPLEFNFNGWGNKFTADKDNRVNQNHLAALCQLPLTSVDLVCEGGALEIDEQQTLLSTFLCLSNPERNGAMSMQDYQDTFARSLAAKQTHILQYGHLQGDDTDGHIDTLVRFTANQGLVIQSCFNRPQDSHFDGLAALVEECRELLPQHRIFELPLPLIANDEGERLPASYANFLINNGQILLPVYQQPEDQQAKQIVANAYPDFTIVCVNALPLVQQFGSIHCISMQIPKGTLKPHILDAAINGPALWSKD